MLLGDKTGVLAGFSKWLKCKSLLILAGFRCKVVKGFGANCQKDTRPKLVDSPGLVVKDDM